MRLPWQKFPAYGIIELPARVGWKLNIKCHDSCYYLYVAWKTVTHIALLLMSSQLSEFLDSHLHRHGTWKANKNVRPFVFPYPCKCESFCFLSEGGTYFTKGEMQMIVSNLSFQQKSRKGKANETQKFLYGSQPYLRPGAKAKGFCCLLLPGTAQRRRRFLFPLTASDSGGMPHG